MKSDWENLERIVQLIEKSISPEAIVEHDVKLPVIGSESGRTRQCDVVIRSGQKPRETITIVEVQDRTSKPDVNTFGGWMKKLEQVGAQHLICVSRHDFPISIKEEAFKLGGTVKLVTLKELNIEDIPFDFTVLLARGVQAKAAKTYIDVPKSELEKLGLLNVFKKKYNGLQLDNNEQCWSLDKKKLVSFNTIFKESFVRPNGKSEGEGKLFFDKEEGPELYLFIEGHFIRVGLESNFIWTLPETELPLSVLSYEQNDAGILAWFAEASHQTENGPISIKVPFVKTDKGYNKSDRIVINCPAEEFPVSVDLLFKSPPQ